MTGVLNIEPNLAAPDEFYEALIDMHRGLDAQQSAMVNARLILLLANHVGDLAVLREAMTRARAGIGDDARESADSSNA
jgi:hypothetical protein